MPGISSKQILSRTADAPRDPTDVVRAPAQPKSAVETEPLAEATLFEMPEELDVGLAAPTNVAILHVSHQDDSSYAVEGFNAIRHPRTPFSRAAQELLSLPKPRDMLNYVEQLKGVRQFQNVALWIKELLDRHGDGLRLVIVEHTNSGVPWEMLRVQESHLGALVATVRWKHVVARDDTTRLLEFEPSTCRGTLVACPDAPPLELGDLSEEDKKILASHIKAIVDRSKGRCSSLKEWREHLRRNHAGVALSYVLCHAVWNGVGTAYLAPVSNGGDRVQYSDLLRDAGKLDSIDGVVFLNACGSAALVKDDYLADAQLIGFAEPFLRRGAKGVIGTIGRVHVVHATRVAQDLLDLAAKHPKTPLAELLRRVRQAALERLDKSGDDDADAIAAWFYTFHYVLFGSPSVCLELQ